MKPSITVQKSSRRINRNFASQLYINVETGGGLFATRSKGIRADPDPSIIVKESAHKKPDLGPVKSETEFKENSTEEHILN